MERAAFLARFPFETFWADLQRRSAASSLGEADETPAVVRLTLWERVGQRLAEWFADRRFAPAAAAVGVAMVAVGLFFVWPNNTSTPAGDRSVPAGIRFRGPESPTASVSGDSAEVSAGLRFFVWNGSHAVPGQEGAVYRENDQMRFTYWSGDNDYLVLLSIEDSGRVTVYYPDGRSGEDPARSLKILRGKNIPLEGSVVLNDYVGRERFFALFSTEPLSVARVRRQATDALAALRAEGNGSGGVRGMSRLPVDVSQATFWIEKR